MRAHRAKYNKTLQKIHRYETDLSDNALVDGNYKMRIRLEWILSLNCRLWNIYKKVEFET